MKRYVYAALFFLSGAVAIYMAFYVGGDALGQRSVAP